MSIISENRREKQEGADSVLDADDLVIGGEDVLAPEAELFVMGFVRDVRLAATTTACSLIGPLSDR